MKLRATDRKALEKRYGRYWAMAEEKAIKEQYKKQSKKK